MTLKGNFGGKKKQQKEIPKTNCADFENTFIVAAVFKHTFKANRALEI